MTLMVIIYFVIKKRGLKARHVLAQGNALCVEAKSQKPCKGVTLTTLSINKRMSLTMIPVFTYPKNTKTLWRFDTYTPFIKKVGMKAHMVITQVRFSAE